METFGLRNIAPENCAEAICRIYVINSAKLYELTFCLKFVMTAFRINSMK